jgi:hypothetical protein
VKVLAGGTYLAELRPPRTGGGPVITVRVIGYTVHTISEEDVGEEEFEVFALVTDLLDTEEYPALDLACCYSHRWGCETVIGRHKTDMGERQPVLRSGDHEGVMQEMWALFALYQALCRLVGVSAASIPRPGSASRTPWPWPWPWPRSCSRSSGPAPQSPPVGPGKPPQDEESRRLPRPEAGPAKRHPHHPQNRVPPAQPMAGHLKARTLGLGGRPGMHHRRTMIDAICYVADSGVKWRALAAALPALLRTGTECPGVRPYRRR